MPFRSGFVSIIGRPNAGKSTLLNALLGQKLAIVTHKPQTTRTRIHGVLEVPLKKKTKDIAGHPAAQIVMVDTPGIHKPDTQLDRRMMQEVHDALESRNAVLFIVDVTHKLPKVDANAAEPGEAPKMKITGRMTLSAAEDDFALQLIQKLDCPVILLLNKIDTISPAEIMPLIAHWSALYKFAEIIPISARKKINLDLMLDKVVDLLPEGQRYFPKHQLTDQPERFLVAELIREKILLLTGEEVPYATAVVIEKYEEPPAQVGKPKAGAKLPVTKISAAIFCERTGQKAILIGKQGSMLKEIGSAARKDIESLIGTRVFLELFVKVQEDWRSKPGFIEDLDWRRQLEQLAEKAGERGRVMASRRPSLPKASEEAQRLSALLAGEIQRWPGVRLGKMFGMVSVYRNDTFFALLPASRGFEKATAGVVKLNPGGVEGAKQWEVLELSSDADLRVALDRLQEVYSKAG